LSFFLTIYFALLPCIEHCFTEINATLYIYIYFFLYYIYIYNLGIFKGIIKGIFNQVNQGTSVSRNKVRPDCSDQIILFKNNLIIIYQLNGSSCTHRYKLICIYIVVKVVCVLVISWLIVVQVVSACHVIDSC
jgi:hypothetical protein